MVTDAEYLRLFVYGIKLGTCSFPVIIESSKTVGELKRAILQEKPHRLKGIDADELTLYKVQLPDGEDLEELVVDALKLENKLRVPSCELSELFPVKPPVKTVSILVDDIATITPSSSADSNLSQNSRRQMAGAGPPPKSDMWSPRRKTVQDMYDVLIKEKLVYVRGTPACGKSTLMLLLDAHIRHINPSAFVYRIPYWNAKSPSESAECIEGIGRLYGEHGYGQAFLLFDDAQDTYDDDFLWSQFFKNVVDGVEDYHVVVFCSYGSPSARTVITLRGTPPVLQDAARITLWPKTKPDGETMNGLLLNQQEFSQVVERQGLRNIHPDLLQLIFNWTKGHVGGVIVFLRLILNKAGMKSMHNGTVLTVESFDKEFPLYDIINALTGGPFGRGLPARSDLNAGVTNVFRCLLKDGTIQASKEHSDPFIHFCHRRGWIFANEVIIDGLTQSSLFYMFTTPLHAVVLSWILDPTNDIPNFGSPLELSIEVISRFKPSQLQSPMGHVGAKFYERPPEAQYQDEFYRCLLDITHGNVRISPEFATAERTRRAGRIDFFIPKVRWGIELTHDGDRLNEHASRFGENGPYGKWIATGQMQDYILLDCRTTNVRAPHPNIPYLYHVVFRNQYQQMCVYNNKLEKIVEKNLLENHYSE